MQSNTSIPASPQPDKARAGAPAFQNRELLNQFRQQIHGLGGLWILIGTLAIAVGSYMAFLAENSMTPPIWGAAVIAQGCVWIALGVLTCLKKMPAVTVGLVLSYASVVLGLVTGGKLPLALIPGIFQGHRVRKMAKKLTDAGIALTTKP